MAVLDVAGLAASAAEGPPIAEVDLELREFEIVGVAEVGPGGAGTLLDAISGQGRITAGRIRHRGVDVTTWPAHRRARAGLTRTFAATPATPAAGMTGTVLDAAMAGQHARIRYSALAGVLGSPAAAATDRAVEQEARGFLRLLEIPELADAPVGSLPPGPRLRARLAAALATDLDVLLLDAPTRELEAAQVEALAPLLLRLRRDLGITLLVRDQHLGLLAAVCDHLHVLERGRGVLQGAPSAVVRAPGFLAARAGEEGRGGAA